MRAAGTMRRLFFKLFPITNIGFPLELEFDNHSNISCVP